MDELWAWLWAFLWTLVLELPVYALWLMPRLRAWWATPLLTLGLNTATHPLFSWWVLACNPPAAWVAGAEVLIAATEGVLATMVLRRCDPSRPALARGMLAACCANGFSYLVGLLALS